MAQAELSEVLSVDKDKLFQAITRYEDYPKFVTGCNAIHVERKAAGHARAKYEMTIMKDLTYTLDHKEDLAAGRIDWTMVSSDTLKKNQGYWELKSAGPGKTTVKYAIEIEFNIPVPGFILNKLVKGSLPAMFRSFEKQARTL